VGLFDSLYYFCPLCGAENETQSKSGPCLLDTFKFKDDLPLWLMEDLNGSEETCAKCKKKLKLIFDLKVTIKKKAIEPIDNLDFVEFTYRKRLKAKHKSRRKNKGL